MQPGTRRAYIVLGIIGVIEVLALVVLLVAPTKKSPTPGSAEFATSTSYQSQ